MIGICAHVAIRFIVVRYSGLIAAFPSLFFTAVQSNHCKVAVALSQVGVVLVVGSSGVIFGYRVSAIWNGNRIVQAIVAFFYLFMVISWVGMQQYGLAGLTDYVYTLAARGSHSISRNQWPTDAIRVELQNASNRNLGTCLLRLLCDIRSSHPYIQLNQT